MPDVTEEAPLSRKKKAYRAADRRRRNCPGGRVRTPLFVALESRLFRAADPFSFPEAPHDVVTAYLVAHGWDADARFWDDQAETVDLMPASTACATYTGAIELFAVKDSTLDVSTIRATFQPDSWDADGSQPIDMNFEADGSGPNALSVAETTVNDVRIYVFSGQIQVPSEQYEMRSFRTAYDANGDGNGMGIPTLVATKSTPVAVPPTTITVLPGATAPTVDSTPSTGASPFAGSSDVTDSVTSLTPFQSGNTVSGDVAKATGELAASHVGVFSALINWGDGTASLGAVRYDGPDGSAYVSGEHTYAAAGTYQISTQIDVADGTRADADYSATAPSDPFAVPTPVVPPAENPPTDVNPPPDPTEPPIVTEPIPPSATVPENPAQTNPGVTELPHVTGDATNDANTPLMVQDVKPNQDGLNVSGDVATIVGPPLNPAVFSAVIDWGDGSSTAGLITADADGQVSISGSHTYAAAGDYAIQTHVYQILTFVTVAVGDMQNLAGGTIATSVTPFFNFIHVSPNPVSVAPIQQDKLVGSEAPVGMSPASLPGVAVTRSVGVPGGVATSSMVRDAAVSTGAANIVAPAAVAIGHAAPGQPTFDLVPTGAPAASGDLDSAVDPADPGVWILDDDTGLGAGLESQVPAQTDPSIGAEDETDEVSVAMDMPARPETAVIAQTNLAAPTVLVRAAGDASRQARWAWLAAAIVVVGATWGRAGRAAVRVTNRLTSLPRW
jgi:hypothetical protein